MMKSWKKRWNDELNTVLPELSRKVIEAPVPYVTHDNGGGTAVKSRSKIIAVVAAFTAFVIALTACLILLLPRRSDPFVFTVEINPAVVMVADDEGLVTAVMAANADADVILSADGVRGNIVGKTAGDAVAYYTDVAARCGYLDISSDGCAVRISCLDSPDLLNGAQTALKEYFTRKGVRGVAVTESVDGAEFSAMSGIPFETADKIAEFVGEQQELFYERNARDAEPQELRSRYESQIVEGKLLSYVQESLTANLEKIAKNAQDIAKLAELYDEISSDTGNPGLIVKDYWFVKEHYSDKFTGEFAALIGAMDDALARYKANYGVDITSYAQLIEASNSYLALSVEKIADILDNFTYGLFKEFAGAFTEIMTVTGIAPDNLTELLKLPETAEEYLASMRSALSSEYAYRLKKNESVYGREREPLTGQEYEDYLDGIAAEYGSLSGYWQALNQKN